MRILELCAGYGGIGLGVRIAVPSARVVGLVERSAYCASLLVERLEAARLGGPALWPDLESFAAVVAPRLPRGFADIVVAGIPCQPHSAAGARRGIQDERWIWAPVRRTIALLRPRFVLIENTPGFERSGSDAPGWSLDLEADESVFGNAIRIVLRDLAHLGYDAVWDRIPAADVGANHFRFRLWIFAWRRDAADAHDYGRHERREQQSKRVRGRAGTAWTGAVGEEDAANTPQLTQRESNHAQRAEPWQDARPDAGGSSGRNGDDALAYGGGRQRQELSERSRREREGTPGPPGKSADAELSVRIGCGWQPEHKGPEAAERRRGAEANGRIVGRDAESPAGRVDDATPEELAEDWYADSPYPPEEWLTRSEPDRAEQLHAGGNGCVPLHVAYALVLLAERAGVGTWTEKKGLILKTHDDNL